MADGKIMAKKAVVYCVEEGRLLVFRHVGWPWEEVGVQVPAGSVRGDETPEQAALRELCEETGRDCFAITEFLGLGRYDITPYRHELQERSFFRARPTASVPKRWLGGEAHDGEVTAEPFEFFWIPLAQAHVLQAGQGAMIWRVT